MLAVALETEVAAYIEAHADQVDDGGRRLVVRNGHHTEREVTTAAGAVSVRAPRVNDKRIDEVSGERMRFASTIVPPWARKSPQIAEVLPLLYLHGMSSGDFVPALSSSWVPATACRPSVITRLTTQWQDEPKAFQARSLKDRDFVYVWADGMHFNVRLDEDRLCALVIVGVRARRHQGTGRDHRRLPRVEQVVGRRAP